MDNTSFVPAGTLSKTNYRLWSFLFLAMTILCFLTSTYATANFNLIPVSTSSIENIDWQNPAVYRSPDFDISPVAMHEYVPSYRGNN